MNEVGGGARDDEVNLIMIDKKNNRKDEVV